MPKATVRPAARTYAAAWRSAAALLLLALLVLGAALAEVPLALVLYYLGVGLVSFTAYGLDKRAAIRGDWRIAEATLHNVDLFGGVIGGLLAQVTFRHKIAKPEFGVASVLIFVLHALGLGAVVAGFIHLPSFG